MNESEPTCAMMGYGPRFFSDSFLDGRVERKYLALTKTWLPTLKSGSVIVSRLQVLGNIFVQRPSRCEEIRAAILSRLHTRELARMRGRARDAQLDSGGSLY